MNSIKNKFSSVVSQITNKVVVLTLTSQDFFWHQIDWQGAQRALLSQILNQLSSGYETFHEWNMVLYKIFQKNTKLQASSRDISGGGGSVWALFRYVRLNCLRNKSRQCFPRVVGFLSTITVLFTGRIEMLELGFCQFKRKYIK